MKVGDLVRVHISDGVGEKIGLIVGRDKRSDLMKHGKDGDFYYMSYYKVLVDGRIFRFEKDDMEKLNNG
jgi:hypothetical protein